MKNIKNIEKILLTIAVRICIMVSKGGVIYVKGT